MMRQPRRLLQALATVTPWLTGSTARTTSSASLAARLETHQLVFWGQQHRALSVRGGASDDTVPAYETLAHPAPGTPFHYAFPVHDLELAKDFYGRVLGCEEGRSSAKWQDYSLHGHQIVAHWAGSDYRCVDYYNPVDGDEVPVPHTGLCLTVDQFNDLAERVKAAGVEFIIEPHLRFQGMPGEQYTMFFKDPSGNNLEFKGTSAHIITPIIISLTTPSSHTIINLAMTKPGNLFVRYNVADN